jgi:hypothetical protein
MPHQFPAHEVGQQRRIRRVGQQVEVRHIIDDLRKIEVFLDGRWLATARPEGLLTAERRDQVLGRRLAAATELAGRR